MSTHASVAVAPASSSKALHLTLWAVQVLLGGLFVMAGVTKSTQPIEVLAAKMPFVAVVGTGVTRFIGVSELLGGLGLILPAASRILPILTPLAGAALALVMVLAAGFHLAFNEYSALPINALLAGLAAFVAWGRLSKARIAPR